MKIKEVIDKQTTNPRQNANILSILTYCERLTSRNSDVNRPATLCDFTPWTLPIFLKGLKKEINEKNLYKTLNEHSSNTLGNILETEWEKEVNQKDPSLLRAIYRIFGWEMIIYGVAFVCNQVFCKISQPIALAQLLTYFDSRDVIAKDKNMILTCATVIVATSLVNTFIAHWYSFTLQHLGMKIRIACCSLIYRKSLRLSRNSIDKTGIGQITNLLSNDVNRFDKCAVHAHSLWYVPIEIGIIIFGLYKFLGIPSILGICIVLSLVPLQVYLGKQTVSLRLKIALKTDARVQLINEMISGIKIIKMYTWEKYFKKLVEVARKLEIDKIRQSLYIKGVLLSLSIFSTRISIFIIVLVSALRGNVISAKYVFVATAFYNILKQSVSRYFIQGISQVGEAHTSVKRIEKFLLNEEIVKLDNTKSNPVVNESEEKTFKKSNILQNGIILNNIKLHDAIENINLEIRPPALVALTGSVGCGKSSFIKLILNELPFNTGSVNVNGKISYCSQEPWIFTGTVKDNIVFNQLFDSKKYKKVLKICALENDLSIFPLADQTIISEKGTTLSGGQKARINLARSVYNDADIYLLDDPLSAVDINVGQHVFQNCIKDYLKNKCVIFVTHQKQYLHEVSQILLLENGEIIEQRDKFKINEQICDTTRKKNSTYTKNDGNNRNIDNSNSRFNETTEKNNMETIDKNVYISYLTGGGSFFSAALVFSLFVLTQVFASGSDYFIAYWVNLENSHQILDSGLNFDPLSRPVCIYVYSSIIGLMVIVTLTRSFKFFKYCTKTSVKLHNTMFDSIIQVPLSFYYTTSSGKILNRFSKDLGSVDEVLPSVLMDCMQTGINVLGVCIIIVCVKLWMLPVTVVILIIFYMLRRLYITTSCNLKRLEATTRSPVFAHANISLQGVSTIRAFGAQRTLQHKFDQYQDIHSSAFFMFLSCSTAFGFWLDLVCVMYIAIIAFVTSTEQYSENVGLSITQATSLTGMFQWFMRQWCDLENQMTSVERINEYTKLKQERDGGDIIPTISWPNSGDINFREVSLKYPTGNMYALNKVSLLIKSKEKIGIVGRTGAGKTSLITALFQLAEIEGDIFIDNINISNISLNVLRSNISIIPQESVLFSGTIQKNLDPFSEFQDIDIWKALEQVKLKDIIAAMPLGLGANILSGETKFSSGQIQLICLARAILRNNKILILDEATASLDSQTDALIQKTIKNKFIDCTVLTIAHRIHTIMKSDRILVMNYGEIVEFDKPENLIKNTDSLFYKMVCQSEINIINTT